MPLNLSTKCEICFKILCNYSRFYWSKQIFCALNVEHKFWALFQDVVLFSSIMLKQAQILCTSAQFCAPIVEHKSWDLFHDFVQLVINLLKQAKMLCPILYSKIFNNVVNAITKLVHEFKILCTWYCAQISRSCLWFSATIHAFVLLKLNINLQKVQTRRSKYVHFPFY